MSETTQQVLAETVYLFEPLAEAVDAASSPAVPWFDHAAGQVTVRPHDSEEEMVALLSRAGIDLGDQVQTVRAALTALVSAGEAVRPVVTALRAGSAPSVPTLKTAVTEAKAAVEAVRALPDALGGLPPPDEIAAALMEHLAARYLESRWPAVWHGACLLGVASADAYATWQRGQLDAAAIWPALSDPGNGFVGATGWGNDLDHEVLLTHIGGFLRAAGLEVREVDPPPSAVTEPADDLPALSLALPKFAARTGSGSSAVTLVAYLAGLADGPDGAAGVVAVLEATGAAGLTEQLGSSGWEVRLESSFTANAPVAFVARPGSRAITTGGPAPAADARAEIEVAESAPTSRTWFELGPLTVSGAAPVLRLLAEKRGDADRLALEVTLEPATVSLAPENPDGFLARLLPQPVEAELSLTLGYEAGVGFYLQRGGGLDVEIPVGLSLGPVLDVLAVGAGLRPGGTQDAGPTFDLTLTGRATLGPLTVTVEGLGTALETAMPRDPDAVLALAAGFVPPTGLGLSLDTGPVRGGGFISHDPDAGRYLGALSLDVMSLGLSAFGILDTRLPDGRDGYSLLVTVSGRFAPIPLGFGFTLSGVGGLLGLHRGVDVDALKEAVRAGTAGELFAPEDPAGQAAELARAAGAVFPVERGQHVLGPTVTLGWGQPKEFVSLDLALALTLPDPLRVVVVGRIAVAVPDPTLPLVRLNMDVMGVLDLTAGTLEAEGRLFDSTVQGLPVVGGFAVAAAWGADPALAFAVGGMHPAVEPPRGFPDLPRLGVDLAKGRVSIGLTGYFAITSNSVQLGARAALHASAAGFTLSGELGFDALVIFEPFGIDLAIRASASVKRGSRTICSVTVRGRLSGPGPWHVRGEARVEVLLLDVGIDFSATIGEAGQDALTPVDAWDRLATALAAPRSWAGDARPEDLVLDFLGDRVPPGAGLAVSQKAVPLDLDVETIGANPVTGARRFSIAELVLDGSRLPAAETLRESFAPAQFVAMSDEDRLAAPAYESMAAGARFGAGEGVRGPARRVPSGRACVVMERGDDDVRTFRASPTAPRAPDRRRATVPPPAEPTVGVAEETWQATGPGFATDGTGGTSHAQARQRAAGGTVARTAEVTA